MYAKVFVFSVETQNFASLQPPYLLQRPCFQVNDKPSHHDVLWDERVGSYGLHGCLVVFDNLVDHNQPFFKLSAKLVKLRHEIILINRFLSFGIIFYSRKLFVDRVAHRLGEVSRTQCRSHFSEMLTLTAPVGHHTALNGLYGVNCAYRHVTCLRHDAVADA